MSAYKSLLKVRAFETGVAQPFRKKRHRHVSERPLVIAYVQMAGEPFSLWGAYIGRRRESPAWIGCADPRNRDLQSALFESLARIMNENVRQCLATDDEPLQVWVSNPTAAANFRRLGRVMRVRQVSDAVSRAGAILDVYAQSSNTPGSALCVAATEILSAHRVTGQSDFEDANLAAQLVWWGRAILAEIDPTFSPDRARALSIFDAAARAERFPMGTLTNPRADEDVLTNLVDDFTAANRAERPFHDEAAAIATALQRQVRPIWEAIWAAHREMRRIKESPSSDDRWADDTRQFRNQLEWLDTGGFRRYTDSPMQAARLLSSWESNQAGMERSVVIEDDLALVEAVLDAKAVVGTVTRVEQVKHGRKTHPFITLATPSTELTEGTPLWLRCNTKISGHIVDVAQQDGATSLLIEVTKGMQKEKLPVVGESHGFIAIEPPFPVRPKIPKDAPWTHASRRAEEAANVDE